MIYGDDFMKRLIALLLVSVVSLTLFASCSDNNGDYKEPPTEKTTVPENIKTVTITSRIGGKSLDITYDSEKVNIKESYSSEATFIINETDKEYPNKSFNVTFIASTTAEGDRNASLGDASVVIKFSPLEKCIIGDGKQVYYYDESWYGEFKTRYYLYEKDSDLIKIIVKEQISNEQIKCYLDLLEF
jgi:hypothetical protein